MSTFLFDKTIFGPVISRRLGISLGINLMPNTRKICNFNCIYCECGWTYNSVSNEKLPSSSEVKELLENKLQNMKQLSQPLDVLTFAGNGEPTMHPEFSKVIDDTILLRNKYFPEVKIAVLSNSSLIHKKEVFEALNKIEMNILKIDSAFEDTCRLLNKPVGHFSIPELIDRFQLFKGKIIIQTMFVKGIFEGTEFDNTTEKEVNAWYEIIKKIKPSHVMIYTIARDTPVEEIKKIPLRKLNEIAAGIKKMGITASVSD
jgi:wyosine [tRNA(Phe)-imidazoG37] synthetase (radical SAM superfamily)